MDLPMAYIRHILLDFGTRQGIRGKSMEDVKQKLPRARYRDGGPTVRVWRTEMKIGHPRALLTAVQGILEDEGFVVRGGPAYSDEAAPIRDTSYFTGTVTGIADDRAIRWWMVLVSIALIPVLIGILLLMRELRWERTKIELSVEGETYWAGARGEEKSEQFLNERQQSGVVSDVRCRLTIQIGYAVDEDSVEESLKCRAWQPDEVRSNLVTAIQVKIPNLALEAPNSPSQLLEASDSLPQLRSG